MKTVTIDLSVYGKDGFVEMGEPSQRNLTMKENALGNCSVTKLVDGEPVIVETHIGDADIINTLVYVRRAPFNNTVKSFLDYCDTMEPGLDTALFKKMKDIRERIEKGEMSPFVDTPVVETEISD